MNEPISVPDGPILPAEDLSWETMRASGPGGQHVNTTESRVRVRFALDATSVLSDAVKTRIRDRFPSQVTDAGELIVACGSHRSQHRNAKEAAERLAEMVHGCLRPPKKRRRTRPTRASKERRLKNKKRRGEIKRMRGAVE